MSASYERINYALRPAKNIERKMIADALRRLREFAPVHNYSYVGFGSAYFSDFSLFHKALGIRRMTSIEKDEDNADRFEFNRPFACVDMKMGLSTDVLPTLEWAIDVIVWLDYDGVLNRTPLADVQFVVSEARAGSVLMLSVNVAPGAVHADPDRVAILRDAVGAENVPAEIGSTDLGGWGLARVCRSIVQNTIDATLRDRNAALAPEDETHFRQIFNFHYKDGVRMLTIGGVFYRPDQLTILDKCAFGDFPYVTEDDAAYLIEVPNLTFREMRHLNSQLPLADAVLASPGVPERDVDRYERVYRYFPAFVDAEV